jgi:hypothetical protein
VPLSPGGAQVALHWVEAESRGAGCGRVTRRLVEDEVAGHRVKDKQVAGRRFTAPRVEVREEWLSLVRC